jgi:hypothetical protein
MLCIIFLFPLTSNHFTNLGDFISRVLRMEWNVHQISEASSQDTDHLYSLSSLAKLKMSLTTNLGH